MPKSNHRGATYAGHRDITPADVSEPQWAPDVPVEDKPTTAAKPAAKKPSPRTRKAGA